MTMSCRRTKDILINKRYMNNHLKKTVLLGLAYFTAITGLQSQSKKLEKDSPKKVREFFVASLIKIGDPVLNALSKNELKALMPVEKSPGAWDERTNVTYLEAFGRTLSGMA